MKSTGILLIVVILLSCKRKSEIVSILEDKNDGSYWVQKAQLSNGTYFYSTVQYIFYKDGSSQPLSSYDENKKGVPSLLNMESSSKLSWSFNQQDSTFKICAVCIFKITKINQDTIFMTENKHKTNYILVKHR